MDNTIKDFTVGQRVQMHPATDLFMRGARFGDVVSIGRKVIRVKLDKLSRPISVAPRNLLPVE